MNHVVENGVLAVQANLLLVPRQDVNTPRELVQVSLNLPRCDDVFAINDKCSRTLLFILTVDLCRKGLPFFTGNTASYLISAHNMCTIGPHEHLQSFTETCSWLAMN